MGKNAEMAPRNVRMRQDETFWKTKGFTPGEENLANVNVNADLRRPKAGVVSGVVGPQGGGVC